MDEIEATDDDRRPTPGKKTSRRRRPGSATKSRPRSVVSGKSAHRSGGSAAASPRDKNSHKEQDADGKPQKRRGSRMRGHPGSSSAPQLRRISDADVINEPGRGDSEIAKSVRKTNHPADEDQGQERVFDPIQIRRPSTDPVTEADISDPSQVGAGYQANNVEDEDATRPVHQLKPQNQQAESRRRHLEHRCKQLEVEVRSTNAELKSYKAEVRAKTIAVGKAEIILNEVCLLMVRRVGRAEGTQMSDNKGGVLLEVHETPAEFAAQIKKNILAQLSKWEIDRAALQAVAKRAGDEAADVAKVHEAKHVELSNNVEQLEDRIRVMELDSQRLLETAEAVAEENRKECQVASSVKEKMTQELVTAAQRNEELCRTVKENEQEFQAQLDRFMEYPKESERMADELDRCQKSTRREKNLMSLERKDFRRQLHMFQKWQVENKELREKAKHQEMQVLTLRRQLAATEAGLAGSAACRKAVIGGTVDRLQRAETTAKHQAHKYRELAGARGVQVVQLETELSSLKTTVKNLRRLLEPPVNESYETEIARFARVNPEVLEVQRRSGLNAEDMQASMAQLLLLREKEGQKDALIALARERDEFELRIKELRSRNAWLEQQVLKSPEALRSVAEERVATVARSEGAHVTGRTERVSSSWGWTGLPNGRGKRESGHASMSPKKEPMSRAENRRGAQGGRREPGSELTARIRRNIRFLEECDRSIEKQREREISAANNENGKHRGRSGVVGGGSGGHDSVAAARTVRGAATERQRPQSAQSISRRRSSFDGDSDRIDTSVPVVTSVPLRGLFRETGARGSCY